MEDAKKKAFSNISDRWLGKVKSPDGVEHQIYVYQIDITGESCSSPYHGDKSHLTPLMNKPELDVTTLDIHKLGGVANCLQVIYKAAMEGKCQIVTISMHSIITERMMIEASGWWQKCVAANVFFAASAGNEGDARTNFPGHGWGCCAVTPCVIRSWGSRWPFYLPYGVKNKENDICYYTDNWVEGMSLDEKIKIATDFSGTSDSCPKSTDVWTDVFSWFMEYHGRWPTYNEVYTAVTNNVYDLEEDGHDVKTGWGLPVMPTRYLMHWSDWHRGYLELKVPSIYQWDLGLPKEYATREYVLIQLAQICGWNKDYDNDGFDAMTYLNGKYHSHVVKGRLDTKTGKIDYAMEEPITRGEVHILQARTKAKELGMDLPTEFAGGYKEEVNYCIDFMEENVPNFVIFDRSMYKLYITIGSVNAVMARQHGFIEYSGSNDYEI